MIPTPFFTKNELARARKVTTRTIDKYVARGLMPPPMKLGTQPQSRVRFTPGHLEILDRNLAALGRAPPAKQPAAG
jgi:DNA-binding transcriptional MerR regulator